MPSLKVLGRKLNPSSRVKVRLPTKNVDSRYNSSEWRALMDAIIRARGRICEDPDHDPDTPRKGVRIFGDHIQELRDGGAMLDARNIMLRCGSCHSRKTAAERAKRMRASRGAG